MSVSSSLSSRRVAPGQSLVPSFRRMYYPTVNATAERVERPVRPSSLVRPSLRESTTRSKPGLVATRLDPSETSIDGNDRPDYTGTGAERRVIKTDFNSTDANTDGMEPRPEAAELRNGIIEKKGPVLVAKRPPNQKPSTSMPPKQDPIVPEKLDDERKLARDIIESKRILVKSKQPPVELTEEEPIVHLDSNLIIARRPPIKKRAEPVQTKPDQNRQNSGGPVRTRQQNVIVRPRPNQQGRTHSPSIQPAANSTAPPFRKPEVVETKPVEFRRVEDVLVVKKVPHVTDKNKTRNIETRKETVAEGAAVEQTKSGRPAPSTTENSENVIIRPRPQPPILKPASKPQEKPVGSQPPILKPASKLQEKPTGSKPPLKLATKIFSFNELAKEDDKTDKEAVSTQDSSDEEDPPVVEAVSPEELAIQEDSKATEEEEEIRARRIRASVLDQVHQIHEERIKKRIKSDTESVAEIETEDAPVEPAVKPAVMAPRPSLPPTDVRQDSSLEKVNSELREVMEQSRLHHQQYTPVHVSQSSEADRIMDKAIPPKDAVDDNAAPTVTESEEDRSAEDFGSSRASLIENVERLRIKEDIKSPSHSSKEGKEPELRSPPTQDVEKSIAPRPLMQRPPKPTIPVAAQKLEIDRQLFQEKVEKNKQDSREQKQKRDEQRKEARAKPMVTTEPSVQRSDASIIEDRRKNRADRQLRRIEDEVEIDGETIIEVGSEGMSVEDLADLLAVDPSEIIIILFSKGVMVTLNQVLDVDSIKVVGAELEVDVLDKTEVPVTEMAKKDEKFCEEDDVGALNRSPIVTVMGHVDHGKTSLLDYVRKSKVAAGEVGGITQKLGAYTTSVDIEGNKRTICFLDTPGHEAFSAMRARGTVVTDIAIIVVAADDGIQPQTIEAINHARAAEVPILIAINKIDVPGADPQRVKRELSEIELLPEEWGGQTPVAEISAKTGQGIDVLLELIVLVADVQLNLIANPDAFARGTVIEAYVDKRSGVTVTALVQNGTLYVGDAIVAGGAYGRVRSLVNDVGEHIESSGPSMAVRMMGFSTAPAAGDIFSVCADEREAREEAKLVAEEIREQHLADTAGGGSIVTLSSLASVDDEDSNVVGLQRFNLVLKADSSGSLEAIKGALSKLPQEAVMIRYLHSAPGEVTEADILLAAAAKGMIINFNVDVSEGIKSIAKRNGVELQSYDVIYDLTDNVKAAMEGRIGPSEDRLEIGEAEVRAVFGAGNQRVAGCMVTEGRVEKGCIIHVMRKKVRVYQGTLTSLRRIKDNVSTVEAEIECGIRCEEYHEWKEGDRIVAFAIVRKSARLEDSHATMAIDEDELKEIIGQN